MTAPDFVATFRRSAIALTIQTFALACGAPRAPAPKPAPEAPALHRGPLTDYVPAAGLRWMLVGSPQRVTESRAFTEAIALLLPPERLAVFARETGVELRQVSTGVIAGFDLGHLYLFEAPSGSAPQIVERFRARLINGERVERPHPEVLRVSGVVGQTPQRLVHIAPNVIAIATGDPTAARVVEAFARNQLSRSPPALRGAALSALGPPPPGTIATFYAPGPFTGEWAHGARGLLADVVALSVSIAPSPEQGARVTLELAGDLPPQAVDELTLAYRDLSGSSTGKLLGLDQPAAPPTVRERENRLLLDLDLDLGPVARGLRAAVIADVWEIMGLPEPSSN